jgi:hypothetical protein
VGIQGRSSNSSKITSSKANMVVVEEAISSNNLDNMEVVEEAISKDLRDLKDQGCSFHSCRDCHR